MNNNLEAKIFAVIVVIVVFILGLYVGNNTVSKNEPKIHNELSGSYTVVFDVKTNKGFVYRNDGDTSELMIVYSNKNVGFVYGSEGQTLINYNKYLDWLGKQGKDTMYNSMVSLIEPCR